MFQLSALLAPRRDATGTMRRSRSPGMDGGDQPAAEQAAWLLPLEQQTREQATAHRGRRASATITTRADASCQRPAKGAMATNSWYAGANPC
jgi:hypothetical protein